MLKHSYVNKSHQNFGIERTKLLLYIFNFDDFANFSLAISITIVYLPSYEISNEKANKEK